MNYIYDVLLNFLEKPYDFYEWNSSDTITHIRKIPAFKVSEEVMSDLENYKVLFDKKFLKTIENKTEVFSKKNVKHIKYSFLVSDSLSSLAVLIDNEGKTKKVSKLLVDEDSEVCEFSNHLLIASIKYKKMCKNESYTFRLRKDIELENIMLKKLNKIKMQNDLTQMKYLFYECFNTKKESIEDMYNIFVKRINTDFEKIVPKLNNIFNLLSINH